MITQTFSCRSQKMSPQVGPLSIHRAFMYEEMLTDKEKPNEELSVQPSNIAEIGNVHNNNNNKVIIIIIINNS